MSSIKPSLIARRRFGPLFATQFAGAFNDNLFRSAMLFSLSFGVGSSAATAHGAALYAALAGAVFIIPYFLFSGLAGQVADRSDKAVIARAVKMAEFGIMVAGGLGLVMQSVPLLFAALFAMGAHSTFFGPIKYSMLPQHLKDDELLAGTGMVEAGTFLAILLGQIAGGLMHHTTAAVAVLAVAGLGFLASLMIPPAPAMPGRHDPIDRNPLRSTRAILKHARANPALFRSALGITWFFALGGVLTQEMPPLAVQIGASSTVAVLLLAIFSIGVAGGSILVGRLQKGVVSAKYVPISALAVAIGVLDLSISTYGHVVTAPGVSSFLQDWSAWRIMADILLVAVAGGVYVVPLYALLQTLGDPAQRSREIAANNVVNAIGMVGVAGAAALVASMGASISTTFLILGMFGLGVAAYSCVLLPDASVKYVLKAALRIAYRVEVSGAENMPAAGERAVVVVNHTSFLDAAVLAAFLPGKPTFAVATKIAEAWWMRPLMKLFDAFPVDPTNPMSAKAMVKAVKEGRTLVIFPEGRITVTGALMKIFDGPGMVADKADAPIIPVRIEGAQYSPFSRLKGKVRQRTFPRISLTVLPPVRFAMEGEMTARQRRATAGRKLYDVMSAMMFQTSAKDQTLFETLLDARDIHGAKAVVVEDVKRQPMTLGRLVTGSIALGRAVSGITRPKEAVGLMLPNVNATVATFFALQSTGRVPAMLNYTAGLASLRSACRTAGIRTILTSAAFLKQAKLEELAGQLSTDEHPVRIVTLESIAAGISGFDKLKAAAASGHARRTHAALRISPDDAACILFTSGSEGLPKAVVLSHRNLVDNCRQLAARVDFNPTDVVLNALPVFHSFGLTGGMLLPVLNGIRTVLYPNPLHYRIVPAFAYDANATIMFGTDTFLSGYARMANPYDFYSLRYVFAGAERVREETRRTWAEKFGVRVFEGYGATEAAPVIAVNTPMHYRAGTVGRALPDVETRLEPVPGIEEGGRLSIRGPNVMLGYYLSDEPCVLKPPVDGWHDTGDIVEIDAEGFIAIKGRAKRFAKIGGEMISLPAVEGYAGKAFPDSVNAVVSRPDERKGEQLVLFTTAKEASVKAFQTWARANGVTELSLPKEIRIVDAIPVLGTGKTDYVTITAMAAEQMAKTVVEDATPEDVEA